MFDTWTANFIVSTFDPTQQLKMGGSVSQKKKFERLGFFKYNKVNFFNKLTKPTSSRPTSSRSAPPRVLSSKLGMSKPSFLSGVWRSSIFRGHRDNGYEVL